MTTYRRWFSFGSVRWNIWHLRLFRLKITCWPSLRIGTRSNGFDIGFLTLEVVSRKDIEDFQRACRELKNKRMKA